MNGFLFLLLTVSLLVMLQIQTGVLQNITTPDARSTSDNRTIPVILATANFPTMVLTTPMKPVIPGVNPSTTVEVNPSTTQDVNPDGVPGRVTVVDPGMAPHTSWAPPPTKSKPKNGAPALSDMDVGSFPFFLINILIHLFYRS